MTPKGSLSPCFSAPPSLAPAQPGARRAPDPGEESGIRPARERGRSPDAERLYLHAVALRDQGRKQDALSTLEELERLDPDHLQGRLLLHKLTCECKRADLAAQQSEVLLHDLSRARADAEVCNVYRRTRVTFSELCWSDTTLHKVLLSAERLGESRIILDATKLLLTYLPESPLLAHALYASARVQQAEGRPDLAFSTLQTLIARFPRDPVALDAQRKLRELSP